MVLGYLGIYPFVHQIFAEHLVRQFVGNIALSPQEVTVSEEWRVRVKEHTYTV